MIEDFARAAICRICHIDFSIGANEDFFNMYFYDKFVTFIALIAFIAFIAFIT